MFDNQVYDRYIEEEVESALIKDVCGVFSYHGRSSTFQPFSGAADYSLKHVLALPDNGFKQRTVPLQTNNHLDQYESDDTNNHQIVSPCLLVINSSTAQTKQ